MLVEFAAIALGVALLAYAADQFVIGAARLARLADVSPIVVGVVVVGFGTSTPELLVSVISAAGGDLDVSVGNIVGSNLANLTLLLGVGALMCPLVVASSVIRRELPLALAGSVAFVVALYGGVERWEGAVLAGLMATAVGWLLRGALRARGNGSAAADDPLADEVDEFLDDGEVSASREIVRTVLGLLGTLAGAQALLWGATELADRAGLSGGFVGVTLVAVGTSLPELVTVIQSARRAEVDLILGNLLGSNLFNALLVGGAAFLIGPGDLVDTGLMRIASPVMLGATLIVAVFLRTGWKVSRTEGIALAVGYAAVVPLFL